MEERMKWSECGNGINKEFEMWQDELRERTMHLRMTVKFDTDNIDNIFDEIDKLKDRIIE